MQPRGQKLIDDLDAAEGPANEEAAAKALVGYTLELAERLVVAVEAVALNTTPQGIQHRTHGGG